MSNDFDRELTALFAEQRDVPSDAAFDAAVSRRIRRIRLMRVIGSAAAALLIIPAALWATPYVAQGTQMLGELLIVSNDRLGSLLTSEYGYGIGAIVAVLAFWRLRAR